MKITLPKTTARNLLATAPILKKGGVYRKDSKAGGKSLRAKNKLVLKRGDW